MYYMSLVPVSIPINQGYYRSFPRPRVVSISFSLASILFDSVLSLLLSSLHGLSQSLFYLI